jgi:alpha-L-fucosidase
MFKKAFLFILLLTAIRSNVTGQSIADSLLLLPEEDMQWWRNAKFGLFIHYGLYSILGKGEWVMFIQRMDIDEYKNLKEQFSCEKFNADIWVDVAISAGCRYMVVTTRHHDGFCFFDTEFGDYDAVNSKAHRDLIAEYAEAAHRENMRLGFYYSPLDWRYPGFFFPDMYRTNAEEMKKQTYTQVRELLTNYGKVDILWYDGGEDNWLGLGGLMWDYSKGGWYTRGFEKPYTGKFSWEPVKLNKMVRELQPEIVISQRSGWMGDFLTQEVGFNGRTERPFELCTNLSGPAWGWTPDAKKTVMPLDSCIRLLVTIVCQDGNLLLNVGPRADGEIEPVQVQRLKEIGEFLSKYGESIYDTRGGICDQKWGGTTVTDKAIYVHVLKIPSDGTIQLPPDTKKVISANYLTDNTKADFTQSEKGITIMNIAGKNNETDLIIKLMLK